MTGGRGDLAAEDHAHPFEVTAFAPLSFECVERGQVGLVNAQCGFETAHGIIDAIRAAEQFAGPIHRIGARTRRRIGCQLGEALERGRSTRQIAGALCEIRE